MLCWNNNFIELCLATIAHTLVVEGRLVLRFLLHHNLHNCLWVVIPCTTCLPFGTVWLLYIRRNNCWTERLARGLQVLQGGPSIIKMSTRIQYRGFCSHLRNARNVLFILIKQSKAVVLLFGTATQDGRWFMVQPKSKTFLDTAPGTAAEVNGFTDNIYRDKSAWQQFL